MPWAFALLASACGSGDTASVAGPIDPGRGAAVYGEACASCHGDDLRGTDRGPSHLSIVYEPNHHPDESFRRAIRNGVPQHHWTFGAMPAIEGLSADDVTAVIGYVRAVQASEGFDQ